VGATDISLRKLSFPLPSEFLSLYKNNVDEGKRAAFKAGQQLGAALKSRNNIQGDDLQAVANILNAAMRTVMSGSCRVEENRVVMLNTGFCPIMRTSMTLGLPWELLDTNFAWPWLEGIVSTIRPDISLTIQSARSRGDQSCVHVFEIGRKEK
jgi:hypothetical protein